MATATKKVPGARRVLGTAGRAHEEPEPGRSIEREGAAAAPLEHRTSDGRAVDLVARREAAAGYDADAERWLDEGGSFSSEAVRQWRAGR